MTREEKKELALQILKVVAATGFIAAAIIAPGIVRLVPLFQKRQYVPKRKVDPAVRFALTNHWITVKKRGEEYRVVLTETGRRKVLRTAFHPDTIRPPARWDRQWRVVIFDIPNKRKVARDTFRRTMRLLGLRQLQESVWVHPYPCERVIDDLANLYMVHPYVRVLLVRHFDREEEFLQKFNLEKRQKLRSSAKIA